MTRRPKIPSELRERFAARIRLIWVGRGGAPDTADPVVNETLGRIVEAMMSRQIEHLDSVPSFVYRTARQVCDESAAVLREPDRSEGDPLARLAGKRATERLATALARLPESDRLLLDAYYCKCLPAHVIALNLGLGPTAVRRRKDQALRRLRDVPDSEPELAHAVAELID